jgi:hypothetical protein
MEKTFLRRTDGCPPRFLHSTARRVTQSSRLSGRLFSKKDGEAQRAGEAITESFDRPFERASRAHDQSAGSSRVRIVPLHLLRSHPFLAALLAISLIDSGPVFPRTQMAARESLASAATEFVHDRIRLELPRIITWRPLPVTPPEFHRRARPRAAPTPNPKAG